MGLKYPEFKKNQVTNFDIILSKTPSWHVSNYFARNNFTFINRYMYIMYPANTKHLGINIRTKINEEYEYLAVNEKLKYIDNVYHVSLLPWPQIHIYYIFEHSKN